jgi:hypothetical protein
MDKTRQKVCIFVHADTLAQQMKLSFVQCLVFLFSFSAAASLDLLFHSLMRPAVHPSCSGSISIFPYYTCYEHSFATFGLIHPTRLEEAIAHLSLISGDRNKGPLDDADGRRRGILHF